MNYLKQLLVHKGFAANFDPLDAYENDPDLLRGVNHELACSLGLRLSQVPELALYGVLAWGVPLKRNAAATQRAGTIESSEVCKALGIEPGQGVGAVVQAIRELKEKT